MLHRLFAAASCALLVLPSPALAQRMTIRIPSGQVALPAAAPVPTMSLMAAPAFSLSAPMLAPGLAAPAAPALALAVAPALAGSLRPAAAAERPAAPLDALRSAASGEDAEAQAAEQVFDGAVTYWNESRGYGFITPKEGGEGVYVVADDIDQPTIDRKVLREGEAVKYRIRQGPNGPVAAKVLPVRLLPSPPGRPGDGASPMRRPLVEGWTVAGKNYASTRELVTALPNSAAPVDATYRFAHTDKPVPPARAANTAVGFVSGGALGALLGTAFFVFGSVVGPIMDVFLGGNGAGPALSELGMFAGFFGGAGALMGSFMAFVESAKPSDPGESITGRIYRHAGPEGETLYFEANKQGGKVLVDLGEYAGARPVAEPAAPAPWPLWKSSAAGLAAGTALAVSQWIPLVQIVALPLAGPAAGAAIGRALTAGTGIAGGWLGGSLGLIVPAAAFLSFAAVQSVGLLMSFGVFVGVLAAVGLVVGAFAANAVRADDAREKARNPAGQWWVAAKGGS